MDLQTHHSHNIGSHNINQNDNNLSQSQINKDSVNTRIDEQITNNNILSMTIKPIPQKQIDTKKHKPIVKNKQKQNGQFMKNHKILQTLRNITKNIKSQINSHNDIHLQKQTPHIEQEKITHQSPQIKYLQVEKKEQKSPEKIKLYSKYKQSLQQFPVYDDKILTDKKQLRQLTIQRDMDNDIQSEDEQIQMGVGYLYYELASSCKKNDLGMNNLSIMKSKSKVKRSNDLKMESVRQKLVFN